MRALRHIVAVLVCAGYLPAATLPCPTPGLERAHAPSTSTRMGVAQDPHAHHAQHAPTPARPARRPEAQAEEAHHGHAGHSAHAGHSGHAGLSGRGDGAAETAERPEAGGAPEAGTQTARVEAPCPCGCGKHGSSSATNARLGPVLISATVDYAAVDTATRTPAQDPGLAPEPFRGLEPVPI